MAMESKTGLIRTLLDLPIFDAEWVLWLLLGLSLLSVIVMIERVWFFHVHRVGAHAIRVEIEQLLDHGDFKAAARLLERRNSLETNVMLAPSRSSSSVTQKRLWFLATIGSNAPFIGLFGTLLGVIKAFADLGADLGSASPRALAAIYAAATQPAGLP
jgi:biopolymer transport protein ExbB